MRRSRFVLLVTLFVLLLATTACRTAMDTVPPPSEPYRIVAYVRGRAEIHRIGAQKLTHINYAFAKVSPEGLIVFDDPDAPAHLAQLQALKAKNPDLRILVSVGGWGADNFSDAALTEVSRARFAASGIEMIKKYGLDGIDLDWEYPVQAGPGIKFRPEDKENFTAMLRDLRQHLDWLSFERGRWGKDPYLLTIASAAGNYFRHTEMNVLHQYLDFINIMTYDMVGSWAPRTGHHAALFGSAANPSGPSTASYVQQHLDAGIPARKLVVGVPFYARAFAGVTPENYGLFQSYQRYASEYSGSALERDIVGKAGFIRHWDNEAKAPFLWNAESATFVTYDDPESLQIKADWVRKLGLGGIMYWEHSHDP
ncbi:MAG TPA: glycoside hydrolase family 18 protein, partial [Thermoanaerobaculia bacterium]|nr:glycoside hydrolase family 18 protein [Thermoanaerobaculia bacterium]